MKTKTMTIANYTKQVELGFIEQVKCISIFKKLAKIYTDCKGNFEMTEITLKF